MFLPQIVIVIPNAAAFFTVEANGVLTWRRGMPTLSAAALSGQELEWTQGSEVTHDVI